jgi:hypothetical protein
MSEAPHTYEDLAEWRKDGGYVGLRLPSSAVTRQQETKIYYVIKRPRDARPVVTEVDKRSRDYHRASTGDNKPCTMVSNPELMPIVRPQLHRLLRAMAVMRKAR